MPCLTGRCLFEDVDNMTKDYTKLISTLDVGVFRRDVFMVPQRTTLPMGQPIRRTDLEEVTQQKISNREQRQSRLTQLPVNKQTVCIKTL